ADAGAITTPTLMLLAGSDWVVRLSAQRQFFERLSSPVKQMEMFAGFYHVIFHEKDRNRVADTVHAFVRRLFNEPPSRPSLLDADKHGYTKEEYDRLCRPSLRFAITRLSMRTLGRLSRGIQLGWQAGFDSGLTLDYVYENRPQGITPLGRW